MFCVLPFVVRTTLDENYLPWRYLVQMEASDEVDDAFPDALREPILRKVQFSTISRIDNLGKKLQSS